MCNHHHRGKKDRQIFDHHGREAPWGFQLGRRGTREAMGNLFHGSHHFRGPRGGGGLIMNKATQHNGENKMENLSIEAKEIINELFGEGHSPSDIKAAMEDGAYLAEAGI